MSTDDVKRALESVSSSAAPQIEEEIQIDIDVDARDHQDDDRFLARFFGLCLFVVGVVTLIPGGYYLMTMAVDAPPQAIPRWTYLVAFTGAVHFVYAIYVFQIADYSALQTLSVFLLIVTCFYGFIAAAILLDENGRVAMFLQLTSTVVIRAAIWSGFMFSISALSCYLIGRESLIWRRKQKGKHSVI